MDVMEYAKKVLDSFTADKSLLTAFTGDPAKIVKQILGVELSDDMIGKIIDAVKKQLGSGAVDAAKEAAEKAAKDQGGILGAVKKILG